MHGCGFLVQTPMVVAGLVRHIVPLKLDGTNANQETQDFVLGGFMGDIPNSMETDNVGNVWVSDFQDDAIGSANLCKY